MDTVMDILGVLKYIGIGLISFFAFCIVYAIVSDILRLLLDVVVFIIIAPFYILFHPIMFITKPKKCLKNILMKTPNIGEDMKRKNPKPITNMAGYLRAKREMENFISIEENGVPKYPY